MNRRRSRRAERHAAVQRAAAEERQAVAAQRAAAEERRAADVQRAADEERQAAAAQRAAAEERPVAAAVVPPPPGGPAVRAAAAAKRLDPTSDQLFKALLGKPNYNHLAPHQIKGRQWLPLPPRAPQIENTFYKLRKEDKTGNSVVDLFLEDFYEDCCNDIGDKRRQVLHLLSSPKKNDREEQRLSEELAGLMQKANNIIKELADTTGYLITLPGYLLKYPALND